MAYVSDSNLTQFWGLAKDYIKAEDSRFANWQKTEKAGAVTCWPVGGTELRPTVDFLFTETGPAEGTKDPDNPSTITGVSEVNVTHGSWNIIEYDTMTPSNAFSGIAVGNADGSVTFNGTIPTGDGFVFRKSGTYQDNMNLVLPVYSTFLPAGSYKIGLLIESGTYTKNSGRCILRLKTTATLGSGVYIDNDKSIEASSDIGGDIITIPSGGGWYTYCLVCYSTTSFSNCTLRPYLYAVGADVSGNAIQVNTDYILPFGSTYYGGSIDLATGLMTVTWVDRILTGIENFTIASAGGRSQRYALNCSALGLPMAKALTGGGMDNEVYSSCSHAIYKGDISGSFGTYYLHSLSTYTTFSMLDKDHVFGTTTAVDNFTSWLAEEYDAGTPVHFVYEIKSPTTLQLSPLALRSLVQPDKYTPRLNTIYTDASAVQVGYVKSPIRSEYELTQAIIATEGGE